MIPRECVVSQHKLLVADFHFQVRAHRDKQAKIERTKWWKLKGRRQRYSGKGLSKRALGRKKKT